MKRNEIIQKLVKEGLSQTTLVNMSDKQIKMLSERLLGEQPVVTQNVPQTTIDTSTPEGKKAAADLLNKPDTIKGKYEVKETEKLKKKKNTNKSLTLKKLEDLDKKEVKEWVEKLIENDYHQLTTKDEIMELVKMKLNEQPDVMEPDIDVEPDIDIQPDIDSPVNPDADPYVDPWDNPGVGPDPEPKFQGDKGMPEFFKFKEILQSINEKKDTNSISESIMREIRKALKNG